MALLRYETTRTREQEKESERHRAITFHLIKFDHETKGKKAKQRGSEGSDFTARLKYVGAVRIKQISAGSNRKLLLN